MRRAHLERLAPICPTCASGAKLAVLREVRADERGIVEGALVCSNAQCQREYPIVDGLPLVLRDLRGHVGEQWASIVAREDLDETTESWLGDACGAGSAFDTVRQQVGNYAWDHYGDLDPREDAGEPRPGSIVRVLEACLRAAGELPEGPVLDLGCSVGRTSFELARRARGPVLGVDLHHAKLRVASRALREGRVAYARRRVGLVYDRREFAVKLPSAPSVDFWSCDGASLPFADATFASVVALNVLDCSRSPLELLGESARVLRPGGALVLACPYDWSASVTPIESWIGGHSQRGGHGGASEPLLRALLTPGAHPQSLDSLSITSELDDLDWTVRLHDRAHMRYRVHAVVARKR